MDHWEVVPDILAVAKSLGGGVMPVGAFCSTEEIWQPMMFPNPFIHTTTTGGSALACSAAIAAIHITLRDRLWEKAAVKGEYILEHLNRLASQHPQVFEKITGRGLLIGMHFHDSQVGYKVSAGLFKRGVLVGGTLTNAQSIRIEPPIVIEQHEIDQVLDRLEDTLAEISRQ